MKVNINFQYTMKLSERLRFIKGLRAVSAWERETGIGRGNLDRAINTGQLNEDNIRRLCRAENIRADWLLFGEGQPYRYSEYRSDAELAEQLQAHFDDECQRWTLTVIRRKSDNVPCAVTLTMPQHHVDFELYPCHVKDIALELLIGPIGLKTSQVICHPGWGKVQGAALDDDVVLDICTGQIGTYALLFEPGYLISRVTELDKQLLAILAQVDGVSEPYGYCQTNLSHDERKLLDQYRVLNQCDRQRLLAISDILNQVSASKIDG